MAEDYKSPPMAMMPPTIVVAAASAPTVIEIERLQGLGFLDRSDGKFVTPEQAAKGLKVKAVRPQTGVKNDPRIATAR